MTESPQKNVYYGSFYMREEMLTLFETMMGDPLGLCVKLADYYKVFAEVGSLGYAGMQSACRTRPCR